MPKSVKLHGKVLSSADIGALKQKLLERVAHGELIQDAAAEIGVPLANFRGWRRHDQEFRKAWDEARAQGARTKPYTLPPRPAPPIVTPAPVEAAPPAAPRPEPPHDWLARPYQEPLWNYLNEGGKRAVAVWHRRAGKESLAVNFAARAANRRAANYWHMLPTATQGRKVVWEGIDNQGRRIIDQAFPPSERTGRLDDEMLLRLRGGSTWQVVGSDNFDRLVGANPAGVVFSEWALADPRAWDYLRPILAENGGWALFIYTPRGRNHGAELFELAQKTPGWFAQRLTVDDTKIIPAGVIDEERRSGMAEELIRQEYYCSFQAALVGSYYGALLESAEKNERITAVEPIPGVPVTTAWDLGIGDSTAIWFAQAVGREIRLVDYYEASGVGLDHYAETVARMAGERGYEYGETLLPHDANHRELANCRTRVETLRRLGLPSLRIVPQVSLDNGINAARVILPRCWFDAGRCARGIEALRQYRRGWDDGRKLFGERPLHDWTSHPADAFRYLAVGLREPRPPGGVPAVSVITEKGDGPCPALRDGTPLVVIEE